MDEPQPTHLDTRDPAKADVTSIRQEVDREIDAYDDLENLVLLVPEDRWDEFVRDVGCQEEEGGETRYRGAILRRAAITAVVAQEGF